MSGAIPAWCCRFTIDFHVEITAAIAQCVNGVYTFLTLLTLPRQNSELLYGKHVRPGRLRQNSSSTPGARLARYRLVSGQQLNRLRCHVLQTEFTSTIMYAACVSPVLRAYHRMHWNFVYAYAYNALAIPLAAGVLFPATHSLLPPWIAALAMALSSVSVVGSSLALRLYKPEQDVQAIKESAAAAAKPP